MAKLIAMGMTIPGVEVSINYNPANLRVTTVDWALLQSGIVARVQIWNTGALVLDRTIAGPAQGTENVPGNLRVRQVTEDEQTFYDLPGNITWKINVEKIG